MTWNKFGLLCCWYGCCECNLVLSLLCLSWVLGSCLSLLKVWNKELNLVCLDCYVFWWMAWNIDCLKNFYSDHPWTRSNKKARWLRTQAKQWLVQLEDSSYFEMFILVSLNQVHQSVWRILIRLSFSTSQKAKKYYRNLLNGSWRLVLVKRESTCMLWTTEQLHIILYEALWWWLLIYHIVCKFFISRFVKTTMYIELPELHEEDVLWCWLWL